MPVCFLPTGVAAIYGIGAFRGEGFAAGLADRAEVELAYAIGVAKPVSIMVETFGTEKVEVSKIVDAVNKVFDCRPAGIVSTLNLKQPIYSKTASYGHFGRPEFPWEKTDKVEALKAAL